MHPVKVLLVSSHPVQYAAPLFRRYAADSRLDVTVAYCSLQGADPGVDPGFGVEVAWDVPLLDGYTWVHMPNRSPRPGLGRFFGLINPGLWTLVRSGNFDAVVAYTGYAYASFWIAAIAAKRSGTALLFGTDATTVYPRQGRRWKATLKRLLLPQIFRLADVVIVPSTGTSQLIREFGIPEERIVLTPFVVDNDWWKARVKEVDRRAVRKEWAIPEDASVVLFCGKLQPWKRPQDLLKAFATANVRNSYLVFAGAGPLQPALQGKSEKLGVASRVRFLGLVNQSKLPAVYASSDVLVLPSEYEPCAAVVIESMLCGCVPIVSDEVWRGRADVVGHGESGFVFPRGDITALADILQGILLDPERLQRMRAIARGRMETWSTRENLEALVQAVRRAAAGEVNQSSVGCASRQS